MKATNKHFPPDAIKFQNKFHKKDISTYARGGADGIDHEIKETKLLSCFCCFFGQFY